MIAWMVYASGIGALVAVAAWGLDRIAQSRGWPTRIPWILALSAALLIPLFGRESAVPVPGPEAPIVLPEAATISSPPALAVPGPNLWDLGAAVAWAALSLAMTGVVLSVLLAVARARRGWLPDWVGPIDVLVSPRFGPALVGVARPAIVMPGWAMELGQDQASIIAKHEDQHRRSRDHLLLLYGGVVTALLPWNPAMWWLLSRLRAAVEVDCDSRTLASGVSVQEYGRTLLEVSSRNSRSWAFQPGLTEPKSLLERRLRRMGRDRIRIGRPATAGMLAASAALIFIACETPAPTNIQDVFDQVVEARAADPGSREGTPVRLEGISSSGDTVFIMGKRLVYSGDDPLIFIDGRIVEPDEDRQSVLRDLDPDAIERVEVVKGAAAGQMVGDRAERVGAIFIYLKDGDRSGDGGSLQALEGRRPPEERRRAEALLAGAYAEEREWADQNRRLLEQYSTATNHYYDAVIDQDREAAEKAKQDLERYEAQLRAEQLQAAEQAQRAQALYQAQALTEQLRATEHVQRQQELYEQGAQTDQLREWESAQRLLQLYQDRVVTDEALDVERAQRLLRHYEERMFAEQLQADGTQRELERTMAHLRAQMEELAARNPDSEEVATELRRLQEQLQELIRRHDQQPR